MTHPTIFHRIAWNWRVHGIPRCAAWFSVDEQVCNGLIWPWQETGGNGEDVEHFQCMLAEDAQRLLNDALESAEWAKAATQSEFAT